MGVVFAVANFNCWGKCLMGLEAGVVIALTKGVKHVLLQLGRPRPAAHSVFCLFISATSTAPQETSAITERLCTSWNCPQSRPTALENQPEHTLVWTACPPVVIEATRTSVAQIQPCLQVRPQASNPSQVLQLGCLIYWKAPDELRKNPRLTRRQRVRPTSRPGRAGTASRTGEITPPGSAAKMVAP